MTASGPVSFMQVWDAMCATILSTGARRGAMMATLRCDHPDIEEFIAAKSAPGILTHFNLSVLVSDAFMRAVHDDADWPLVFPERGLTSATPLAYRIHKRMRARALWDQLCRSAYDSAEPGVVFIDRINAWNNLGYCETLSATNPCAEEPLPPYGACDLGSINLCAFVVDPFTPAAHLAEVDIASTARLAVRFLDNVIDVSRFPLPRQQQQARYSRRIGLGITGLADALAMLGLRYDSPAARLLAGRLMRLIRDTAYETSIHLAAHKGAFPGLDAERYLQRPFVAALPEAIRSAIRRQGIRNSHLTAIAPAGTISLLAGNVSSGIEPIFGIESERRVLDTQGLYHDFPTTDFAYAIWRAQHATAATMPDVFIPGDRIAPEDQLSMLAALQPSIDGSISKTVMLPEAFVREDVSKLFRTAYELGLKGCAVYRTQARAGVIADRSAAEPAAGLQPRAPSCVIDRECD
jgi:ribonucleoside-diphosphate reductase alpha chain